MEGNINEIKNNIQILEQHVKELKTQGIIDSFTMRAQIGLVNGQGGSCGGEPAGGYDIQPGGSAGEL